MMEDVAIHGSGGNDVYKVVPKDGKGVSRKLRPRKLRPQTSDLENSDPPILENSDLENSDPLQTRNLRRKRGWKLEYIFITVKYYTLYLYSVCLLLFNAR